MSSSVMRAAHQVSPSPESVAQPVQPGEEPVVRALVRLLGSGEPGLVDAVVHVGVDHFREFVDLVADGLRIEVRSSRTVMIGPLGREVQGDPPVVVGDQLPARNLDHGRHGDPPRVVGDRGQVRLLQPVIAEHRIDASGVEVEGPAPLVVGRSAQSHRDDVLQAEQPANDDRPVGPRAGAGRDQPIAARLDRVSVTTVPGDPGRDVVSVPGELGPGHLVPGPRMPSFMPAD